MLRIPSGLKLLLVTTVVVGLLVGCSGAAATPSPSASPTPSPSPSASDRIEVTLSDEMRIEPGAMTIPVGRPVTFVVTNGGAIDHEFFLGDEAMQAEHEEEMTESGGMMGHDEENGISVEPGETRELTHTFASPAEWLAGCHVPGHYDAGMRATVVAE